MSSGIFATFLLLATGLAAAASDAGQGPAEIRKATSGPAYEALAAKSGALLEARDAAGLAAHLAALEGDTELQTPAREKLLHDTLMAMGEIEPDDAARNEVARLKRFRSITRAARAEHGHTESYLLFDVSAAARFAERQWDENSARKAALAAIERSDSILLERYVSGDGATRRGIEQAVATSTPEQLISYGGQLAARLRKGQPVARLAAATAVRTTDVSLMLAVLADAPPQVALHALHRLRPGDWHGQTLSLLTAAAARPAIASAAMLRLGELTDREPEARALLLDAFGSAHGSSAAAAVARTGADDMIDELARVLDSADSDLARRQALLGLRLADTPRARTHLAIFAARPDTPAHLAEEVPAWLRD